MTSKQTKLMSGWELFRLSIAGDWNKSAVKQIVDGVIAGLTTTLSLKDRNSVLKLTNALTISGSLIIVDRKAVDGTVLFIEPLESVEVAYHLLNVNGLDTLKVWEKGLGSVVVKSYAVPPDTKTLTAIKAYLKTATLIETVTIPNPEGIVFVENGLGILVPGQASLERLDDLSNLLEKSIGEEALRWFVAGYGADIHQLNAKASGGGAFGEIPDGATFEHMYDSAYTADIFKQMAVLVPAFKEVASNFTVVPGESGIARFMGLQPYMNKVTHTQTILTTVFDEFGLVVEFENIIFAALRTEITGASKPTA